MSPISTVHFPDDADANLGDNGAGSLLFMARTCVGENVGDFCSTGVKEGQAVTVCRSGSDMGQYWNINDNKYRQRIIINIQTTLRGGRV